MKKLVILSAFILMILIFRTTAYAGDAEWHFIRNDNDTLLIGQVSDITDTTLTVEPISYIVSSAYCRFPEERRKQLRPKTVIVYKETPKTHFNVGDYVVASLNEEDNHYVSAWGIYKVDSPDYKTLTVTYDYDGYITDFLNNGIEFDGQQRDYFDELFLNSYPDFPKAVIYLAGKDYPLKITAKSVYSIFNDIFFVAIIPIILILIGVMVIRHIKRKRISS